METAKEAITVGHLALYYLESLISIEDELLPCSDDPYGNKRCLLFKFSEELSYCMQVAFKINIKVPVARVERPCAWQFLQPSLVYRNVTIAIGETNQEATFTYHW